MNALTPPPFKLYGIELEYMLVDEKTLDVLPAADRLFQERAGAFVSETDVKDVTWSNELVLHVMEMKVRRPVASLLGLGETFADSVREANSLLERLGARLMPSGAHPWMNPDRESRLWPHEDFEIYQQFDRIFGCRSHGWTNLQSMHINLPFSGDMEFARLHAAIRLLMPILPALAASSPYQDGRSTGLMDSRLESYRTNAQKVPAVAGKVIPEAIFSPREYREQILEKLYHEIAPYDLGGILRYEWLNARGAIPRFERDTIEIRVLDVQECPQVDLAIAWAVTHVLKTIIAEAWRPLEEQMTWEVEPLRAILLDCVRDAEAAAITNGDYLETLGYTNHCPCTARDVWTHLMDTTVPDVTEFRPALHTILDRGPLARRLLKAGGLEPDRDKLTEVYSELSGCLADNRLFLP